MYVRRAEQSDFAKINALSKKEFGRDAEGQHFFVIDDKGRFAGFFSITDYYKPECSHLTDLIIMPDYRGKGIGTLIIRMFKKYSRFKIQTLLCKHTNKKAMKLYIREGFKPGADYKSKKSILFVRTKQQSD